MKNAGYVNFGYDKADGLNVTSNPLPNHSGPKINVVLENLTRERKTCIRNVATLMGIIYRKLAQAGFFQSREEEVVKEKRLSEGYCQYHAEV